MMAEDESVCLHRVNARRQKPTEIQRKHPHIEFDDWIVINEGNGDYRVLSFPIMLSYKHFYADGVRSAYIYSSDESCLKCSR